MSQEKRQQEVGIDQFCQGLIVGLMHYGHHSIAFKSQRSCYAVQKVFEKIPELGMDKDLVPNFKITIDKHGFSPEWFYAIDVLERSNTLIRVDPQSTARTEEGTRYELIYETEDYVQELFDSFPIVKYAWQELARCFRESYNEFRRII